MMVKFFQKHYLFFILLTSTLSACLDVTEIPFISLNADFSPDKSLIQLGDQITFMQQSTTVASNFSWDFGDGVGTSQEKSPSYTYTDIGTYTVNMLVTKADNITKDSVSKEIRVLPATNNVMNFQTFGTAEENDFGFASAMLEDGGSVIAGRKNTNVLTVMRTGSTSWNVEFANITNSQIFPTEIAPLLDGGFLVIGYYIYGGLDGNQETDAFAIRLDANGEELWRQIDATSKVERFIKVIEQVNALLIVGYIAESSGSSSQIKIDFYGDAGTLENSIQFGNNWTIQDVVFSSEGEFVVAANEGNTPLFLRLSPSFDILSRTFMKFTGVANGVTELNNGEFAMVGEINSTANPDSSNAFVARFDEFGTQLWVDSVILYQEKFTDIFQNTNDELIIFGTHFNPLTQDDILAVKYTDLAGQSPSVIKLIGGTLSDVASKSSINTDQSFNIIGTTSSFGSGKRDIYQILLNSNLE